MPVWPGRKPVSDWLIMTIGPGGLISVLPHLSSPSSIGGVAKTWDGVTCDVTIEMLALRKQKSTNF
jgi:hypothetical protein